MRPHIATATAAAVAASRNHSKSPAKLTRPSSLSFQTSTTTPRRTHPMATVDVHQLPRSTRQQQEEQQYQQQQQQKSYLSSLQAPHPRQLDHLVLSTQNATLDTTLCRPIPNSYWATPYLLACEYPWAPSSTRPKLDALLAAGVRTFIDLTVSGELIGYSQLLPIRAHSCGLPASETHTIEYFRFPIPDRKCPESPDFMARILALLHRCEKRGRVAAVHCRGGIGRTGTVVGCWLVQSGRVRDGEEALKVIAQQWSTVEKHTRFPCSPETGAQAEFVRIFKRLPLLEENCDTEFTEVIV